MLSDEDWFIRRFPDGQDAFDVEYSGLFRLLSAGSQNNGQRTVDPLVGFSLKQINQQ
jgi:hypothetical protein